MSLKSFFEGETRLSSLCFVFLFVRFGSELTIDVSYICAELPVSSPLIHGVLRVTNVWLDYLKEQLDMRGPPPADYIPGCVVETNVTGPRIHKYQFLLEKGNTPFQ